MEFNILGNNGHLSAEFDHKWREEEQILTFFITIEVGQQNIWFAAELFRRDLLIFRRDLQSLYANPTGSLDFVFRGQSLTINAVRNSLGHIHWNVGVELKGEVYLSMKFSLRADQTYLPPLIHQINFILEST